MRIGIFGSAEDLQSQAVSRELRTLGAQPVLVSSSALDRREPVSFTESGVRYQGQSLDDIRAYYVRQVPMANVPVVEEEGTLRLYEDWYGSYMQSRERASVYLAWLLKLERDGVLLVNSPHAGSVLQSKPYQLHVLKKLGAQVPRTLISNHPEEIVAFAQSLPEVIYKPVMGGALTRVLDAEAMKRLDLVRASPVIFQERIHGDDLRVMLVDGQIVSSVAIETPEQQLDFRGDAVYSAGAAQYREVKLPETIEELCRKAARECGLRFAGIDIKHHKDAWVFLELNSSPIYLDVELKLGHPISKAIAQLLCRPAGF